MLSRFVGVCALLVENVPIARKTWVSMGQGEGK